MCVCACEYVYVCVCACTVLFLIGFECLPLGHTLYTSNPVHIIPYFLIPEQLQFHKYILPIWPLETFRVFNSGRIKSSGHPNI